MFLAFLQKLGKALMTPIAVLPAAAILLRLGAPDVLNLPWMFAAGGAIFDNLALIFAIGIAIGLAVENNGVAAIAAVAGYFVLTKVAVTFNDKINMGVLAGIIVGILAGLLYNKYKDIKVPSFLGFFGGKRFAPIVTAFACLVLGAVSGYVWPLIQNGIASFGNFVVSSGAGGAGVYGVLNRALIPVGLHHVLNSLVWFQFGEFTNTTGKIVTGDLARFFAGDPTAGNFMTGFFPVMMFGLPAACLAIIRAARPENRKAVSGMFIGIALTSFLTGITEPIEFSFMFLAPILYIFHALMTGLSLAVSTILGVRTGFGFSAGLIDYVLSFGIATKPLVIIAMGLAFAVIYYFVFLWAIMQFNLPTPGRLDETRPVAASVGAAAKTGATTVRSDLKKKSAYILSALGGQENLVEIDACVTRIRLVVKNPEQIDEKELRSLGASAIIKMPGNSVQVVFGTLSDPIVTQIKPLLATT